MGGGASRNHQGSRNLVYLLIEWLKLNYQESMVKRFALLILTLFASLLAACNAKTPADIPLTRLANYQVVDLQGTAVARVEDVLIAAGSGQISYAIVSLESSPFHYSKAALVEAAAPHTAVPWAYFSLDTASAQLQLQVEKSVLYAAPRLTDKPDELDGGWDAGVLAYWQSYPLPSAQE